MTDQTLKPKLCHNCGKPQTSDRKKGVWAVVNRYTFWFHSKTCFTKWNRKYKSQYTGGLL